MLLQKFLSVHHSFFRNISSKALHFKVLDGEMDINEPGLQKAKMRSDKATSTLKALLATAEAGGGAKAIHRHTVINKKLLVRERLKLLLDSDSPFLEIGILAGMSMDYGTLPAAGSVVGIGKIHDHYCIIGANDATVKGGAFFPISITKQLRTQRLAFLNQLPCIYLVDSGGAFLPLQAEIFPDKEHGGRTFYNEALMSANGIPQIAVVCGSSTAGGAYCPTMAEEAIIVKKSGVIFLGGPPLVKAATGEIVSEQDLGGAELHCSVSGCTDYYAETEEEAYEMCRESILALNLPMTVQEKAFEEPLYPCDDLKLLSGKQVLSKSDIYKILSRILDRSMFKEFKTKFGVGLVTGFGYIHGMLIGLLANSDYISYQDAQKGVHFIQLCEKRQIPLVFLQNSGYNEVEADVSMEGIVLKDRAKMVSAHCSSTLPKIVLNIGGCFGDENFTMCGWSFEPNFFFSWPLAHSSLESGVAEKAISRENKILSNLNDEKDMSSYSELFENNSSAFFRASRMLQDGIIFPEDTRKILALCLDIATSINSHSSILRKSQLAVLRM